MRKALASFLIAFMVAMPVLACCCPEDTQALSHNDKQASHQHHDNSSTSTHSEQDCSKVDLQVSSQVAGVQSSDLQNKIYFDYIYASNSSVWTLALASDVTRNTPLIFDSPHLTLPVFLTTQRLRI